jgi:hypothetical protein
LRSVWIRPPFLTVYWMVGSLLTLPWACARQQKTPVKQAGVEWKVPSGCEHNLSGRYAHAADPRFEYAVQDTGKKVTFEVLKRPAAGPLVDGGSPRIELERTPVGFVGQTLANGFNAARQTCSVQFATHLTACDSDGLTLETASTAAVDEACHPDPQRATTKQMDPHRLNRIAVGDAGVSGFAP